MKGFLTYSMLFMLALLCCGFSARSQSANNTDSFAFEADSLPSLDSLSNDTLADLYQLKETFSLLDSLSNDTIINAIFKSYAGINNVYFEKRVIRKNLPTVKEVKIRAQASNQWKFWIAFFIIAYIAFVRIANANNFRVFLLSVFNLKLSRKIWEDQRYFFGFVILQLFAIYLFIAAMFINNYMELKKLLFTDSYFKQYGIILAILSLVYIGKFLLHAFFGMLFKMQNLATGFVSNTISVNNFMALIVFPVAVFSVYANSVLWALVLAQTIIAIFFVSIIYRLVRIVLLSNSFFSFPTFYLFLYLCALEVAPWFIIVKYLNSYNI